MNRAARSTSRGRLLRRRGVLVLLVIVTSVVLALLVLLACLPVREFTTPTSDEASDRRARQFENRFVSELTRVRGVESPWAIRVRQDDLNAWFWNRLPHWAAHLDGSDSAAAEPFLQAALEPDRIRLMSESMVLSIVPAVHERSTLIQPGRGSALGRLPLPPVFFQWTASAIDFPGLTNAVTGGGRGEGASASETRSTDTAGSLVMPALFPLGDGRSVELLEIRMDDQQLVLVFQTLN